jgi:hypothetical protein
MNKKTLAFTRGSQTYHATYDDDYAITWAADNPPLPDGVKTMPTGGQIGTDGAFLRDGDVVTTWYVPATSNLKPSCGRRY